MGRTRKEAFGLHRDALDHRFLSDNINNGILLSSVILLSGTFLRRLGSLTGLIFLARFLEDTGKHGPY